MARRKKDDLGTPQLGGALDIKISEMAGAKGFGGGSTGGKGFFKSKKSRWTTKGTPENEKRLAARKNYKKKVLQHIEASDARANSPKQISAYDFVGKRGKKAESYLMKTNADRRTYTPGQKRASEQLNVSLKQGQRKVDKLKANPKPPAPMDLLTSKKVIKGQPPQRRSQKEEIVIATAKTKKSQVLANKATGTPAKLRALPSGIENVQGVSGTNPFAGKATGTSGKIQRRMKIYQESSKIKSAGYKAREELKSATPQQLSDAHSVKPPKKAVKSAPKATKAQYDAFAKDMEKMGSISRFSKQTKKFLKRKK